MRWWVLVAALLLGAALRGDALKTGFYADDYQQLSMLQGRFLLQRPVWDAFWFGPRDAGERAKLIDFGLDPWWTAPEHTIAMFRPLSSVLLALDVRVFGENPIGYHLHSFAWWAALIVAVWALLFRVLPAPAAALGSVLFAIDESQDTAVCWIANRSTLVAVSFGAMALLAQLRAMERRNASTLWLAAACWTLAMAAGEYGIGMVGYGIALAWWGKIGTENERSAAAPLRAWGIAAAAVPAGAYLLIRSAVGCGVVASGLYVSPGDPVRFLAIAPARWLALVGELVLDLPAGHLWMGAPFRNELIRAGLFTPAVWTKLPSWAVLHAAIGALAIALAALALRWLAREESAGFAALRWLITGSVLAVLSAGAALPESRLLVAPALGVSAALGVFVWHAWQRLRERMQVGLAVVIAAVVLVHGPLAARASYRDAHGRRQRARATLRSALSAELPERVSGVDVVLISPGDFSMAGALPWIRQLHGSPLPRSYRRLSGASAPHVLRRLDDRTLELGVLSDAPGSFAGSLYRPSEQPFMPGQQVHLPRMDVQVLSVRGGDVTRFAVRFDRPLESPDLVFLHAAPGGLRRLAPPALGQELLLPRPAAAWE